MTGTHPHNADLMRQSSRGGASTQEHAALITCREREEALPHAWWRQGIGRADRESECAQLWRYTREAQSFRRHLRGLLKSGNRGP